MGGKKANVAVGRSLLKVIWCVLKTGQPYREPDAGVMHEMERQKLVHHHARRLRALGADQNAVEQIVEQLLCPAPTEQETQNGPAIEKTPPEEPIQIAAPRKRKAACLPKGRGEVCRGKLGFRARQTRQQYTVFKEPPGKRPRPASTDLPSNNTRKRSRRRKGSDTAPD
jgi:hypothetical protein